MAKKKKPKIKSDYVIKVRIDSATGKLKYDDEYQEVESGKKVEWDCPYDYAIQFASGQSPFAPNKPFLSAAKGDTPKQYTIKAHAGPPLPLKYAIAVFNDGINSVIADDPQIIIDNSGGKGGKEPKTSGGKTTKSTKKKAAKK